MQYMTRKGTTGLKSAIIGAKRNMCNIQYTYMYCVLCIVVKCVLCIDKKREIDRGVGEVERYHVQPQQV